MALSNNTVKKVNDTVLIAVNYMLNNDGFISFKALCEMEEKTLEEIINPEFTEAKKTIRTLLSNVSNKYSNGLSLK